MPFRQSKSSDVQYDQKLQHFFYFDPGFFRFPSPILRAPCCIICSGRCHSPYRADRCPFWAVVTAWFVIGFFVSTQVLQLHRRPRPRRRALRRGRPARGHHRHRDPVARERPRRGCGGARPRRARLDRTYPCCPRERATLVAAFRVVCSSCGPCVKTTPSDVGNRMHRCCPRRACRRPTPVFLGLPPNMRRRFRCSAFVYSLVKAIMFGVVLDLPQI